MKKSFSNFTKLSRFSIRKRLLKERSKKLGEKEKMEERRRKRTKRRETKIHYLLLAPA